MKDIIMKSRAMGMSTLSAAYIKPGIYQQVIDSSEMFKGYDNEDITREINLMHIKARALGFPAKVNLQIKIPGPVKINTCSWVGYPNVVFFRSNGDFLETLNEFSYDEYGMSNEVCSLLILMKIFYRKDWTGKDWIKMPKYEPTTIQKDIVDKLSKSLAEEIDQEIVRDLLLDAYNGYNTTAPEVKFEDENKFKVSDRITFGMKIISSTKIIISSSS